MSESPGRAPESSDPRADPWADQRVFDDRFQLVRELGRGAMGAVHVVFDRELCREVALKRMLPEGIGVTDSEERFRRESRALAAIAHPGVPQLHHSGRAPDGAPWFTMEIVRGESLRALLARDRLTPARALKLAIELGHILAAAHEAGVIHRDVKPSNIMIEPGDRVRLLDFGVCTPMARFLRSAEPQRRTAEVDRWHTQDGDFAGTFGYSDPATFDGAPATPRSDIFSLAAILYELLTGRRLFDPDGSVYRSIDSAEFPTALASLAAVLRRAAAHNPFERPRSMPEFIQSLEIARGHMLRAEAEARAPYLRVLPLLLGVTLGVLLAVTIGLLAAAPRQEPAVAPAVVPVVPATEPAAAPAGTPAGAPAASPRPDLAAPASDDLAPPGLDAPASSGPAPRSDEDTAPGDLFHKSSIDPKFAQNPRSNKTNTASIARIRRALSERHPQIQRCMATFGAPADPLALQLELGASGAIREVQLAGGGWFLLRRCITTALADLSFPPGTPSPQPLRARADKP